MGINGYSQRDWYLSEIENRLSLSISKFAKEHEVSIDDLTYTLNKVNYEFMSKCLKKYIY